MPPFQRRTGDLEEQETTHYRAKQLRLGTCGDQGQAGSGSGAFVPNGDKGLRSGPPVAACGLAGCGCAATATGPLDPRDGLSAIVGAEDIAESCQRI